MFDISNGSDARPVTDSRALRSAQADQASSALVSWSRQRCQSRRSRAVSACTQLCQPRRLASSISITPRCGSGQPWETTRFIHSS